MNRSLQDIRHLVEASSGLEANSRGLSTSAAGLALAFAMHAREEILDFLSEVIAVSELKDYWGDDPHRPPPGCPTTPFQPKYIALMYLGLEDPWKLKVNHACYELPATVITPEARRDWALDILEEMAPSGKTFGDQTLTSHRPPYKHQKPIWLDSSREYDSGFLHEFKFKSPNEIFIFLHHKTAAVRVGDKRLLSFKQIGADNKVRRPNDTFYNARVVPNDELRTLTNKGTLIRVENYATDVSTTMTETLLYSMDIKFQIDAGDGMVTMIIDPDTGNGTGNEP